MKNLNKTSKGFIQNKTLKYSAIGLLMILIVSLSFVAYKNPELFKAESTSLISLQSNTAFVDSSISNDFADSDTLVNAIAAMGLRIVPEDNKKCLILQDLNDSYWKTFYVKYYNILDPEFPDFGGGIVILKSTNGHPFTTGIVMTEYQNQGYETLDGETVYRFDYRISLNDIEEVKLKVRGHPCEQAVQNIKFPRAFAQSNCDTMESSELTLNVHLAEGDCDSDGIDDTCDATPNGTCGDGVVDSVVCDKSNEQCDGATLNNETCQSQGFDGGTLGCSPACDAFDTTACTTDIADTPVAPFDLAEEAFDFVTGNKLEVNLSQDKESYNCDPGNLINLIDVANLLDDNCQ